MQDKDKIRFKTIRSQEAVPVDMEITFLEIRVNSPSDVEQKGQTETKGKEETVFS